jgi:hypothetical protein
MDCFVASAPRNDGVRFRIQLSNSERMWLRIPAARCARVLRQLPPSREQEGAGKAGCTLHPRSRVQNCTKTRTRAYRFSGGIRPSLRNGFTAYSALSSVNGLSCHRRPRDTALDPFGSMRNRELDASIGASGPHDFAVRVSHARQSQLSRPPHPTARS